LGECGHSLRGRGGLRTLLRTTGCAQDDRAFFVKSRSPTSRRGLGNRAPGRCHPERSRRIPLGVYHDEARWEFFDRLCERVVRTPCGAGGEYQGVGILRLRRCFAIANHRLRSG
jgi:hypothetical protein